MNNDIIASFTSIEELRKYARINGFDGGQIDLFIAKWELFQLEQQNPTVNIKESELPKEI